MFFTVYFENLVPIFDGFMLSSSFPAQQQLSLDNEEKNYLKQKILEINQLKTKSWWSRAGPKSERHRDSRTQGSRERATADEGRDRRVSVTSQGVLVTDRNWEETSKDSCLEP